MREGGIVCLLLALLDLIVIGVLEVAWRSLSDKWRDEREEDADQNETGLGRNRTSVR